MNNTTTARHTLSQVARAFDLVKSAPAFRWHVIAFDSRSPKGSIVGLSHDLRQAIDIADSWDANGAVTIVIDSADRTRVMHR